MDVFRFKDNISDGSEAFVREFLLSHDFDQPMRFQISHDIGISTRQGATKEQLCFHVADYVARALGSDVEFAARKIVQQLPLRPRKYVAFQYGNILKRPDLKNPLELVFSRGTTNWYGPIKVPSDPIASWYIRPMLLKFRQIQKRLDETVAADTEREQVTEYHYDVRWLCLARVDYHYLSLHWSNFTTEKGTLLLDSGNPYTGRFPYWKYIPKLFEEIIKLTEAKVNEVRLENLILNQIWDIYREDNRFKWTDIRVRAEHRGIALSAKAGALQVSARDNDDMDIDEDDYEEDVSITGINYLAQTIARSVSRLLQRKYKYEIPDIGQVDDEILRTIIKEYNPKSYQFQIDTLENREMIAGAHVYFGKRPGSNTPDCFSHMILNNIREMSAIDQVKFLMQHFDPSKHLHEKSTTSNPEQNRLF